MPAGTVYTFGPFQLDSSSRRLTRDGGAVAVSDRHLDVLEHLVGRAGTVVTKNALIDVAWRDVAVTDNSLEQAISALRRTLGVGPDDQPYIQTIPRQGYRFTGPVSRAAARASDATLDALLAPHRAWLEGRAALETLEADQMIRARAVFERMRRGQSGSRISPCRIGQCVHPAIRDDAVGRTSRRRGADQSLAPRA